jgi:S1-C subfamily serine protease
VIFLLLVLTPLVVHAQSVQEALLRAKPAVAVVVAEVVADVTADCGAGQRRTAQAAPFRETGTGWFIASSGWLITNAHVVAAVQEPSPHMETTLRESGIAAACGDARAVRGVEVKTASSVFVILSNGRRLTARIVKYSPPVAGEAMSGRNLALLRVEASDMPTLPLGGSARTKIGDPLHTIGFPNVVMSHELLSASAQVEASITSGSISGFKEDVSGQAVIQTDASAAAGDSGAPAVNERGQVIGVLTFVSRAPAEGGVVQGFNFIIPISAILDFVKDAGFTPGEAGAFNRAWWAALGAFFAGDYAGASGPLREANRIVPDLPDVRRIAAENDERIKNPPPRPFPWRAMGLALTAVGAIASTFAWTDWWKRNRFRVRPRDVARWLDSGESAPVVLDVRDSDTYRRSPVRIARALHVPAERLEQGDAVVPVETDRAVVAYCT